MQLTIKVIDAFTNKTFAGNPAAVIQLDTWLTDELMLAIAQENNLSETAFIVKTKDEDYQIRWFSPLTEIDFCGHATLASAFVLFEQMPAITKLTFLTDAVGKLKVNKRENGFIEMVFPNKKPTQLIEIPDALSNGLSIAPHNVYLNQQAYFVVYQHEEQVRSVKQNTSIIKQLAPYDVVVTAQAKDYDFISRYFWPANGGDEDPVTGSIHAGLVPLWAEILKKDLLMAFQASSRGGELSCRLAGEQVLISGQAVHYLTGTIYL